MGLRYALSEIRKHGTQRHWWRHRLLARVVSSYYAHTVHDRSTSLLENDWDNVLLLDACRFDLFEEALGEHPLPGELGRRHSLDSATPKYLQKNFGGGTFHDIVYVTANPYVTTKLPAGTFYAVESVWKDGWDEESSTVRPDTMADRAIEVAEAYPDKRLIVHFNQPHAPFVGDVSLGKRRYSAIREEALGNDRPDPRDRAKTPFEMLEVGEVTRPEVWEAYLSNLLYAMPSVERLLTSLEGKNVVTADHGNALGEFAKPFPIRVYGHPAGILIPALTEVPWHVYQNGDRKEVVAEKPNETESGEMEASDKTRDRLRALGYAE